MAFKWIFFIAFLALLISCAMFFYNWKNPEFNRSSTKSIHQCIYGGAHHNKKISSMGNVFDINYVSKATIDCINPYFPAIHMVTNGMHNAWVHIVYTNCSNFELQKFIDMGKDPDICPFYTLEQDFYDAPHWSYTFFKKPLTMWKGHAYAVQIDHQKRVIQCVGGIEWGFFLDNYSFYPKHISPSALTMQNWEKDASLFKEKLARDSRFLGYVFTAGPKGFIMHVNN